MSTETAKCTSSTVLLPLARESSTQFAERNKEICRKEWGVERWRGVWMCTTQHQKPALICFRTFMQVLIPLFIIQNPCFVIYHIISNVFNMLHYLFGFFYSAASKTFLESSGARQPAHSSSSLTQRCWISLGRWRILQGHRIPAWWGGWKGPFSLIRCSHLEDFTHRSLREYCKYISVAASAPHKPWINPLWEGLAQHFTSALAVFTHTFVWLSWCVQPQHAPSCLQGNITCSPSAQENTSMEAQESTHSCVVNTQKCQKSTKSLKHQTSAPPWIWAFHTQCLLQGASYYENSFVRAKNMTGF